MPSHRALNFELWESSNSNLGMRIPDQIEVSDDEKEIITNLRWSDLYWSEIGGDDRSIAWLEMSLPIDLDISKGIVVDVQLIRGELCQVHISLAEQIRGIGLGTKIYRSLIKSIGHLYSDEIRRNNPIIKRIFSDLEYTVGVKCFSNESGDICISDKNPNKDKLIEIFNSI